MKVALVNSVCFIRRVFICIWWDALWNVW